MGAAVTASDGSKAKYINDATSRAWSSRTQGVSLEFDFGEEILFNTIVIRESTDSVKEFSVSYFNGSDYELLFKQDRIDKYRLCAMEDTKTSKGKITFDSFDKKINIEKIEFYYLADYARDDFKVTSYVTSNYYGDTNDTEIQRRADEPGYAQRFGVLTDAIIIGVVSLNQDGTLTYTGGIENFKKDVRLLKSFNLNMKVRCTIMTNLIPEDFHATKRALVKFSRHKLSELKRSLRTLVEETGIDGIDYDWEYPQPPHEWTAYSNILIASKEAIAGRDLSVALWPYGVRLSKRARACIDNVNIMAYDQFDERGDQSSIYEMGLKTINYFLNLGFSKEQLRLEIPFYGRTADKYAIWPSYDEDYGKWNNYRENFEYTDSNGNKQVSTVYLNGYAMVRDKTALALQEDLGGIMIFNSSCDISYESRYALHRAVNEVIEQRIPAEYR